MAGYWPSSFFACFSDIIADNEVSVHGYDIVRRDRPLNGRNGGGACFYIRSNINYDVSKDLVFDQLESLNSIKISKPRSKSFIAATWYRRPNLPFELFSDFESFVGKLDAERKEYYVMGDFNCKLSKSLSLEFLRLYLDGSLREIRDDK